MYNYCIAYKDGNILIRYGKGKFIQRYDKDKKIWVDDREMLAIFTDKMPSRPISEDEANSIINESNENR